MIYLHDVIIWCHDYDFILWFQRFCLGYHAMKSIVNPWNHTNDMHFHARRSGSAQTLLHFSGNSISIKSRGYAHNTPLLPIIPPLIPFPIRIVCSPRAAARRFWRGTIFWEQREPGRELLLEIVFVSFAVDGVERGQTRFRVRFRKSFDAIVTVCTIVGGCYHKSCNVGD